MTKIYIKINEKKGGFKQKLFHKERNDRFDVVCPHKSLRSHRTWEEEERKKKSLSIFLLSLLPPSLLFLIKKKKQTGSHLKCSHFANSNQKYHDETQFLCREGTHSPIFLLKQRKPRRKKRKLF